MVAARIERDQLSSRLTTRPSTRTRRYPSRGQGREFLAEAPLAAPHHGGEDRDRARLRAIAELFRDLLGRLGGDGPFALRAMRAPQRGEEHPQVVVDLGDGADGGARMADRRPLLDGDGRARVRSTDSTSGFSIWSRNCRA